MALILRSFKVPTAGFSEHRCLLYTQKPFPTQATLSPGGAFPVTVNRLLVLKNGFVCLFLSCKDALPLAFRV